eukprot:scaffold280083_cov42-Prasinocladus_malaysianus.AAC.1
MDAPAAAPVSEPTSREATPADVSAPLDTAEVQETRPVAQEVASSHAEAVNVGNSTSEVTEGASTDQSQDEFERSVPFTKYTLHVSKRSL